MNFTPITSCSDPPWQGSLRDKINNDSVVELLLLASAKGLEDLLRHAQNHFKVHLDELKESEEMWDKLKTDPDLLVSLFQRSSE